MAVASESRRYESVIIFSPKLGDSQLKDELKKFETLLVSNGAKDVVADHWGRKEMAYLMKKERFGQYVCLKYESANHQAPNVLASLLRIADSVHKFETHTVSGRTRKVKPNPRRAKYGADAEFYEDGADGFD